MPPLRAGRAIVRNVRLEPEMWVVCFGLCAMWIETSGGLVDCLIFDEESGLVLPLLTLQRMTIELPLVRGEAFGMRVKNISGAPGSACAIWDVEERGQPIAFGSRRIVV